MTKCFLPVILLGALLAGCATAARLNQVHIGMTRDQVISLLGRPDSTSATGNMVYYTYYFTNDASYGRDQPYMVRLIDDKVESFGRFIQLYDAYNRPTGTTGLPSAPVTMTPYGAVTAGPVAAIAAPVDLATEIQRLKQLKDAGVLTDEEFQKAKAKVLSEPSPPQ